MARDRDGGGRQPTFKRSQRSTYAELPHSPAGAIAPRTNRGELVRRAGATPRAPACGGIIDTGKERDDETGLYYHGARYYAAWLGRWTSADPLGLQAGLNLYLYGRASPVVYVDPSGMFDVMAMANLGQAAATNAAFSAADAEARSWAPDSSDALSGETVRPSTEYDAEQAATAMADSPSRAEPAESIEPGNMGFGTNLVSPGDLYEQAQLDADNAWRQEVLERKDYTQKDTRGHKLWTQNAQTGEMDLAPDRYLELPVGTGDVEPLLAVGGLNTILHVGVASLGRWQAARAAAETEAAGLVHMTDAASAASITESSMIRGPVYALPRSTAGEIGPTMTARTGLGLEKHAAGVPIPRTALPAFKQPVPIGPITTWQRLAGTRYTSAGTLDLASGTFTTTGPNRNQAWLYAVDIFIDSTVIGSAGLYWHWSEP
jgi:RHS repeat-associated protein